MPKNTHKINFGTKIQIILQKIFLVFSLLIQKFLKSFATFSIFFNHCDSFLSCKSVFHQKSNDLDFGTEQNKKGMFSSENVPPCNTVRFGAQGVALGSDVAHHCSARTKVRRSG